jgi:hypothetical protein
MTPRHEDTIVTGLTQPYALMAIYKEKAHHHTYEMGSNNIPAASYFPMTSVIVSLAQESLTSVFRQSSPALPAWRRSQCSPAARRAG